jgi:hypothetical protein
VELVGEQQRLVLQQHEPQQPVRKRKATSKVWQHFKEIPDGAKCNYECVESYRLNKVPIGSRDSSILRIRQYDWTVETFSQRASR